MFGPALTLMLGIAAGVTLGRIALTVWTLRHPVYCGRGCRRPHAKGPVRFMDAGAAQAGHSYFTGLTDRLRYRDVEPTAASASKIAATRSVIRSPVR